MKTLYIVKYTGPFGFIKPWTAVRDSETYSQQFLTQSIIAGIERKIFPELLHQNDGRDNGEIKKIAGHRLSYKQVSQQQEQIQPRGWNKKSSGAEKGYHRPYAILVRGILIEPILWLAFVNIEDAEKASKEHICLCRNEDILYPIGEIIKTTRDEFDSNEEMFSGFELIFEETEESFLVGYNRIMKNEPMYGYLKVIGTPVKSNY